jgi:hypothetical protein
MTAAFAKAMAVKEDGKKDGRRSYTTPFSSYLRENRKARARMRKR